MSQVFATAEYSLLFINDSEKNLNLGNARLIGVYLY